MIKYLHRTLLGSLLVSLVSHFNLLMAAPTSLAAPNPIAPVNGAVNQQITVSLDWTDVTNASEYEYQYSTNSTFTSPVSGTASVSNANISGLANSTAYFWRVRAKNGSVVSEYSNIFNIVTTTPISLEAPNLVSPSNSAVNQPVSVILDWTNVTNAWQYEYQYSANIDFTDFISGTVTSSMANISGLLHNTTYYWRVRSKTAGIYSPFIELFHFTTREAIGLDAPALVSPRNVAAEQGAISLTLDWSDVPTATQYEYEYSTVSNFATVLGSGTVNSSSVVINGLQFGTTHYWRVRAKNSALTSDYSLVFSFRTAVPIALYAPVLLSSSNGAINQPINVTLDWENVMGGASEYVYQLSFEPNFLLPETVTVTASTAGLTDLLPFTTYYWRVKAKAGTEESAWSEVWQFTTNNLVSVDAPITGNFKVYPNPATSYVEINSTEQGEATYELIDVSGKLVLSGTLDLTNASSRIATDHLTAGMYHLKLQTAKQARNYKLAIVR